MPSRPEPDPIPAPDGTGTSSRPAGRSERRRIIVVGNGMVGHTFVAALAALDAARHFDIVVFGEEPRFAYDRVALSSWFAGTTAEELTMPTPGFYAEHGITVHTAEKVDRISRENRRVRTSTGRSISYDVLVLATGSYPFVPALGNQDAEGTFVYRTIDDLEAIAEWAMRTDVTAGAVIGGGLLGLEAANALHTLGLETHVVEFADRLMPVQVDGGGGRALRAQVERLGVHIHTGRATSEVRLGPDRRAAGLRFADPDHADLDVQLVLYSAGIRPRDELARQCGLVVGERGGVVVDDQLRTSDPSIHAIGEVALHQGRIYGLVAPGYEMARVLASNLVAELADDDAPQRAFTGAELSTKLKLLGVDVASFGLACVNGDPPPSARAIVWDDPVGATYKKVVVDVESGQVLGGVLVGDAAAYPTLLAMSRGDLPTPADPAPLLFPAGSGESASVGVAALADTALICSCNNVVKGQLCAAVGEGCHTVGDLKAATTAGTGCGGCQPLVKELLQHELAAAGLEVDRSLCEHFAHTRQDLFALMRVHGHRSFAATLAAHGRGDADGCDICKPAVASILASLSNGHILDGEQASLQDTNDHFLANMQKDGTYSVVPRVPGGEITPDGLISIGQVAKDFGLYTKITGGQRIDLFGARVEELPVIWERLIEAGFESGHAYGKALRTVKSCVGSTWCRYGVQDSVGMAILIELRYRGLRAPHKIKMAVSGCARECAEAQGKDVGIIATERGWNLYVGGNGGMRPQHAHLFAEDLDDEELIRLIDRFVMFYIHTADRLERTATWLNKLEGGLDELRAIIVDDKLGLCADLDADMQRHVDTYECEWKATIDDPERVKRFVSFVNAPDAPDPEIVFVQERGQIRPARPEEKRELVAVGPGSGGSFGHAPGETEVEVRTR